MGKVIGIVAIKGGVGKTTISSTLATNLAIKFGKRVLLVDANYSAPNTGLHMGVIVPEKTIHDVLAGKAHLKEAIHPRFGVDVVPGSYTYSNPINPLKLKDRLAHLTNEYDFIILDSSPSLNDEVLSTMIASDEIFVVTTPDYPTLACSFRAASLAKERGKPISGIILNKTRDPHFEIPLKNIQNTLNIPVVAKIPDDLAALRSVYMKVPIPVYNKNSAFVREVCKLGAALCGESEVQPFFKKWSPFGYRQEEVNRQVLRENFYSQMFSD